MSPAGRPRTFDEELALEAAMLLFWRQGYEATSLAQLREATGLSSASLYGAFGSKEGLFTRAVEHYIAGPGSVTDVITDETLSAREAIARLLHGSIDMQTDPSHPRGCLVALSATVEAHGADHSGVREVVAARRATDRARIAAAITRDVASGELAQDTDVDAVTTMIHGFLLGISTQVCDGVPARQLHSAADTLLGHLDAPRRHMPGPQPA
ncbi:TetR/AcrR family transcriptional regulator [Streptomyces sp. Rer75]|uniref:TetR/AcrR family transcriptional regulator n=1 Tax=Streptomyces sp. Rer75 TaxID=2750011 RepID=UPI0015D0BE57|nr:TetR/AcrR family transcriptional regulator [Streptomyces sp. Rer75]QLH20687.1 TetR/AcrR family transcriptional regulator [Streptomyces sp. Rer75]